MKKYKFLAVIFAMLACGYQAYLFVEDNNGVLFESKSHSLKREQQEQAAQEGAQTEGDQRVESLVRLPPSMQRQLARLQGHFIKKGAYTYISKSLLFQQFSRSPTNDFFRSFVDIQGTANIFWEYLHSIGKQHVQRITLARADFVNIDMLIRKVRFMKKLFRGIDLVCRGVEADGMREITQRIGDRVLGLTLLFGVRTRDENLAYLGHALRDFPVLRRVELNLWNTNITDKGFEDVRVALQGLSGLQEVVVNIGNTRLTGPAVTAFRQSLGHIPSVTLGQ